MFYSVARPILFSLDAERAHEFALDAASLLARATPIAKLLHAITRTDAPVTYSGLTFPNRVGLAGGMDKNAVAPAAWWAFGFGFVELGTITPRPQSGNPQPRMWRDIPRLALFNRMGFNNDGAECVAQRLANLRFRPPFPLGISVGKNATTLNDRATDDYVSAAATLAPHADFISINVSSPNTTGLRQLQDPEPLRKLVMAVRAVIGAKLLLVKVDPDLPVEELLPVIDACLAGGASGVIATNTKKAVSPTGLPCGESGRPLRERSRERVAIIRKHVGDEVLLVGVGGIEDAASARAMIDAGADLIQVYSALVYRGPFLAATLARSVK